MKILVVGGAIHYADWIFEEKSFLEPTLKNVPMADIVYFTGGEDVDPSIYGYSKNPKTNCNPKRDREEQQFYKAARENGKMIIGTCRGSQFLTAMQSKGLVVQHVNGHATGSTHEITFNDGDRVIATSTHHQMMYPFNTRHQIIAWSSTPLSDVYELDNPHSGIGSLPDQIEPEIVYYRDSRSLAIQPHPEYMEKTSRLVIKLNELLTVKMNSGLDDF